MCAFASLGGTVYLITALPKDFLPNDDIGFIQGFAQAPDGTSPFETKEIAQKVEAVAIKNPYVEMMVSLGAVQQSNQGVFYFRLTDIHKRPPTTVVADMLNAELSQVIVDAQVFLKPLPLINLQVGAQAAKSDYQYTLTSLNSKDLYATAENLEHKLKGIKELSTVTSDVYISQPQLHLDIDRNKASVYNVTAYDIERALSLAYADINLSPINEPDNQYYVIMETLPEYYKDPQQLSHIWLCSQTNNLVPFTEVVRITENVGPLSINHINGLPSATISFNLENGVALSSALNAIEKIADEVLPATVYGRVQGAADIFKQSFSTLNFLLLVTIFIIYIILGILYENFFHPFTVMSTLSPAAFGGLLSLLIFGYSLSLYAFVGVILLLGIVMKNGIILVDFANESVENDHRNTYDAIYQASVERFRPIVMTTFAALMGAIPIAIGVGGVTAASRRPLGVVIVGGLIFSQVLTLYLTPVIYLYVERLRQRLHRTPKSHIK
jgi:HAE1 family hydrophobic/amphiphilic exporter-1